MSGCRRGVGKSLDEGWAEEVHGDRVVSSMTEEGNECLRVWRVYPCTKYMGVVLD